ncbi:MAG TPA: TetR/AcrR family transcriptional regulator [Puia sp.]|nr:TetR/AcrR family transcriptional regulator [Puia sp.]
MENNNKERILQKATDLFMRYGIRSITMDEIAAQLGISKKTIYQYFTDKDEIVEAVVNQQCKKNELECIEFRSNSENAVHAIFIAVRETEEMLSGMNPLIMYDLEKHHPKSYKRFKDFKYQFFYKEIKENLARGIKEELYRPEIDADIVAKHRIESAFMGFNQELFPQSKYKMGDVLLELAYLFLYSVTTLKGRKLIEKYMEKNVQKNKHGLYE